MVCRGLRKRNVIDVIDCKLGIGMMGKRNTKIRKKRGKREIMNIKR
jgi:hypothetical protein